VDRVICAVTLPRGENFRLRHSPYPFDSLTNLSPYDIVSSSKIIELLKSMRSKKPRRIIRPAAVGANTERVFSAYCSLKNQLR
jgi:hypothetical protein